MIDLFENDSTGGREILGQESFVLKGFALPAANELLAKIVLIKTLSPFRHMTTPGGFTMPVGLLDHNALFAALDKSLAVIEFDPKGAILTANHNFLKTMG